MGWDGAYDGDLGSFRMINLVRDVLGLVSALGHRSVAAVVGHDFGSPVAAWCALLRPDVFRSVVLMSAPFGGPPQLPFDTAGRTAASPTSGRQHSRSPGRARPAAQALPLVLLDPRSRRGHAPLPQGIHAFLRAYYHHKSADWMGNKPYPLAAWTAEELAKLPTYYVMERGKGMAETVAPRCRRRPRSPRADG